MVSFIQATSHSPISTSGLHLLIAGYDIATTPFHRLLDSGALSIKMTRQLQARSRTIDPYRLKVQLEYVQRTLATRAVRSDCYVRQP
jgi:hypothetical protein